LISTLSVSPALKMRACAKSRCSLLMVSPTTLTPKVLAAYSAKIDGFGEAAIFVVLGCGEVRRAVLEQGGRIGHAGIEPRRIERVADVVVRIDVAAGLPPRVAVKPMPDELQRARERLRDEHRLHPVLIDAEQIEELRQIGRVPFAAQIGFCNPDVAAAQEA
jgi:hypothetical protein